MSGAALAFVVLGALVVIGAPIALSIPGTRSEWTQLLFESAAIGLVVELFVAIVLLHAGYYSIATALTFTVVLVAGAVIALRRSSRRDGTPGPDRSLLHGVEPALIGLATVVLVGAALWIRRAPSYFIFQTGDMGGYVNSANILMRSARFGTEPNGFTLFLRETNLVLGRANTVAGLPALGAILLLGVIAFARTLRLHVAVVLGIGLLVVVHPVTVWYSLFPAAESLYAPLVIALLYFVVRARSLTSNAYATIAGIVAGSLLLVRGEAMLLAPVIVLALFASTAVDDDTTIAVQRRFTVVSLLTLFLAYAYDVHYVHAYFVTQLHHLLPGPLYRLTADAHLVQISIFLVIAGAIALAAVLWCARLVTRVVRPRTVTRSRTFWRAAYAAVVVVTAGALATLHVSGLGNTLVRWGPVLIVLVLLGLVALVLQPGEALDAGSGLLFLLVIGTYIVLFARRVPAPKVQTYYLYFDRYLYSEVLPAALVLGAIGLHLLLGAGARVARSSRAEVTIAGRIAVVAVLTIAAIGLLPQIDQTRHATKYRLFGHSYAALQSLDRLTGGHAGSAVVYSGSKMRPYRWFYPNTYRAFALPLQQSFDRQVFGIPPRGLGRDAVYDAAEAHMVLQRNQLASGYLVVLQMPGRSRLPDDENTRYLETLRYACPTLGQTKSGSATSWMFAELKFDIYAIK